MNNIIPFGPLRPDSTGLAALIAYWQALRRGHSVPARADLDPKALAPWLAMAGLVECDPDGALRFRIGGQGLHALLGTEARGMPLRSLFAPGARARLHDLAQHVFHDPALLRMNVNSAAQYRAAPVQLSMVMLPLRDQYDQTTRALICLDEHRARAVKAPVRFEISHASLIPLSQAQPRAAAHRLVAGGRC
jgi:hypothetical protein